MLPSVSYSLKRPPWYSVSSKIRVTQLGIINSVYKKTEKKNMKTETGLAVESSVFKVIGRNKRRKG